MLAAMRSRAAAGDLLRERGTIRADDVTIQAMKDKGLEPESRKQRRDITCGILVSLHDLKKADIVQKFGHGRGVTWQLKGDDGVPVQ